MHDEDEPGSLRLPLQEMFAALAIEGPLEGHFWSRQTDLRDDIRMNQPIAT
jgi:hypothetical protein